MFVVMDAKIRNALSWTRNFVMRCRGGELAREI